MPTLLDREAVAKAIADRMALLASEWAAIEDDPAYCNQLEFARGQLDEVLNDIIAGDYDIERPISLVKLPSVFLVKDLVRRHEEGDPSLSVYPIPDEADSMEYRVLDAVRERRGEFRGPGVVIAAFGEVV